MLCLLAAIATACHTDNDNLFTSCVIKLNLPTSGEIDMMQYRATVTNLNSREEITLAGKTPDVITINEIMRGAYSINIEGVISYRDNDNAVHTSQFRAQSDYVSVVDNDNIITLEIVIMDE